MKSVQWGGLCSTNSCSFCSAYQLLMLMCLHYRTLQAWLETHFWLCNVFDEKYTNSSQCSRQHSKQFVYAFAKRIFSHILAAAVCIFILCSRWQLLSQFFVACYFLSNPIPLCVFFSLSSANSKCFVLWSKAAAEEQGTRIVCTAHSIGYYLHTDGECKFHRN